MNSLQKHEFALTQTLQTLLLPFNVGSIFKIKKKEGDMSELDLKIYDKAE
jgi:hypothetical protein